MKDELGRITEGEKLGHDNPKLFNAAYLLMMRLNGKINTYDFNIVIKEDLNSTQIVRGLWSRHTTGFRKKNNILLNPISHDECNGIAIANMLIFGSHTWSLDMLEYLKENENCYADTLIGVKPFTVFMNNPIGFLSDLYRFHKAIKNNPHNEDGQDAKFPPDVVALRYWRRPRDTGFYKLAAGKSMNLIEWLDFHLAWIFSLFVSYKQGQQNSGTLMTAYKLLALGYVDSKWRFSIKILNLVMSKRLGDKWLYEMCKAYFKNPYHPDLEHIITTEAKEISTSKFFAWH